MEPVSNTMPESDWHYLQSIKPKLLDRLCARILDVVKHTIISPAPGTSQHQTYLEVYRSMQNSDAVIAECFNDWRRSTARQRLYCLMQHHVIEKEELAQLSLEVKERAEKDAECTLLPGW